MRLLLLLAATAVAGRRKVEPIPEPEPEEVARVPVLEGPLFPAILPLDPGPIPAGLAHRGAQACAACHPRAWASWTQSPHAGPPSEALLRASTGLAGCTSCHLPSIEQQAELQTALDNRIDQVESRPNPVFDPSAWLEGVTCSACHVRGGAVLASTDVAALRPAPHPLRYASELAGVRGCAACHELRLEGATEPLYDTVGEWQRAGFEDRGIACIDCHGGGAADGGTPSHDVRRSLDEGLSALLAAPSLVVERGGEALPVVLTLVNTGAGHAIPTGSPWKGLSVRLHVVGPPDRKGVPAAGPEATLELVRTLAVDPPFATTSDRRLSPGASVELPLALALPDDAPPGAWELVLDVRDTIQGEEGATRLERRWPLRVE